MRSQRNSQGFCIDGPPAQRKMVRVSYTRKARRGSIPICSGMTRQTTKLDSFVQVHAPGGQTIAPIIVTAVIFCQSIQRPESDTEYILGMSLAQSCHPF